MRRLILMRHAKSSWSDPDLHDAARPLNDRGRDAAPKMGAWLAEIGCVPDLALISTARRALETWALVAPALGQPPHASSDIYMAGADALLEILHSAPDDAKTLLMLGHEPGLPSLMRRLQHGAPAEGCGRALEKFPTAAAAVLEFEGLARWIDVEAGCGVLTHYAQPRDFD